MYLDPGFAGTRNRLMTVNVRCGAERVKMALKLLSAPSE
jgi:hypothetical protein